MKHPRQIDLVRAASKYRSSQAHSARVGGLRRREWTRHAFLVLSLGLSVAGIAPARAATEYWDTGPAGTTIGTQGSGMWDTTTTNWESTATKAVWTNGNVAAFATAGATVSATVNTNAGTTDAAMDSINVSLGQAGLIASQLFFNNTGFIISAATAQTLTISNGGSAAPAITVANGKSASLGANATLNLVATNVASSEIVGVGGAAGGTFNVETGGTLSYLAGITGGTGQLSFRTAGDLAGETGTINVNGTINFAANTPTSQIGLGQTNGAVTMNVNSGGLVTSASTGTASALGSLVLSNNGAAAILNVNTGGAVTLSSTAATAGLNVARGGAVVGTANTGTVNLNGGTITTERVFSLAANGAAPLATSTFNFNGGTLSPNVNNTTFLTGLTRANVRDGGAIFDTAGFNVTVGQALVHSNVTGNNPNTNNPDSAIDGGLIKNGAGTLTLNGVNTYTGPTLINAGTLAFGGGGSLAGTTVTAGTATTAGTLQINGAYTISTSGSPSVTITANNGALSLQDTTINTLTINSATAGSTVLTIGGGNTLSFDAGATTADQIALGAGLLATAAGANTVNINVLARPSGNQTLTLINAPGGFSGSARFTLGTVSGAVTSASSFGLSLALASTTTQLQLIEMATPAPTTAYFTGSQGTSWAANNGTTGNFSTDSAGNTGVSQLPGAVTDVHLYATNANTANVSASTLDAAFTIKSLTLDGSTLGESGAVGIAPGTGGSLTLSPTSSAVGITVNGGAGALTISAPVTLGTPQTWTNNSASLLTVSGTVANGANGLTITGSGNTTISGVIGAGAGGLIMNGAGTLTLSGANTYTGGTTISAGTVAINNAASLGAAAGTATINAGTLEATASINSARNFLLGSTTSTILVDPTFTYALSGTIADGAAAGTLNKTGAGTLSLTNANATGLSYTGGTNITAGTLNAGFNIGAANSSVVVRAGSTLNFAGNASNTGNTNTITGAGNVTNSGISVITGDASGFTGTWTANQQNSLNSVAGGNGIVPATSANAAYVSNFAGTNAFILGSPGTYNFGSLAGTIGELRGGNTLVGGSAVTAVIGNLNTSTTFAGIFANNASAASATVLSIVKVGTGNLTLSGANLHTGGTTVSGGILTITANSALGAGNATVASTATSLTISTGVTTPFNGSSFMLTLAGGGTAGVADVGFLDLTSGANITIAGLVLGTTNEPAGVYTAANAPEYILGAGTVTVVPVPEPSGWVMTLGGLAGLAGLCARRQQRA